MADVERRNESRLKTLINVVVALHSPFEGQPDIQVPATCLDISDTGMLFTCERPMKTGYTVTTTVKLPGGRFRSHGTVVRCEPVPRAGRWRIAIHFAALFEDNQRMLADFLAEERRKRMGW